MTTGSFYGHFDRLDGFVTELLARWESTTAEMVAEVDGRATAVERIAALKGFARSLPHDAEGAIRAWGRSDEEVAAAVARVDERRRSALVDVLAPAVGSPARGEALALVGMTLLVGLQTWRRPVSPADVDLVFDELEALVLAELPASAGMLGPAGGRSDADAGGGRSGELPASAGMLGPARGRSDADAGGRRSGGLDDGEVSAGSSTG